MSIKEGRVAIVTGAGQGIGACIAKTLAKEKAWVAVCDVNEANAKAVAAEIEAAGGKAMAVAANVASKAECERLVAAVVAQWGTVDILVNNAAVMSKANLAEMTEEQWDTVMNTNLKGPFLLTQAVCGIMTAKSYGRVINITDSMFRGDLGQANYAASKAGLIALTKTCALELGKCGVTANSVCPGFIDPPMAEVSLEQIAARAEKFVPCKKPGKPADVAAAVCFFAAEETAYVTGQTMSVDGGMQNGFKGLQ
ncbi:MAG: SDR family oxidoreductase [Ruminococcaceae bacterium]|nr:SDR family oxidoreductase [Oscillospiraceae bacterium]